MQRPALVFALLFSMCATRAALAEDLPNFNIDSICSVGRAGGAGAGERNADQGCRASETDARRQLENRWTGFKDESRRACVQQTQIGGLPSYVDVLTCIELAEGKLTPSGTSSNE